MGARLVLLLVGLLSVQGAGAHALRVFAAPEGTAVQGYAYHPGAGGAGGVEIRLEDAEGAVLAQARSDAEGRFRFPAADADAARVVAVGGDGHRAEFRVRALGTGEGTAAAGGPAAEAASRAELEALVARQVAPLREDLQRLADQRRLQDVLGGLGYLLGLAGLGAWLRARKAAASSVRASRDG